MGGEKRPAFSMMDSVSGSPPRERGKEMTDAQAIFDGGLPPRGRGKGDCSPSCHCAPPDHPRVGGEKPFLFYGGSSDSGSPPRRRGKGGCCSGVHWRHGITPAWAGKRPHGYMWERFARDHPREGGDKGQKRYPAGSQAGSPPRGGEKLRNSPRFSPS